ncbi:MAG: hypothetical protein FWE23_09815 [Chitinivibrionia bacterium]|nr:hypothetical protein [Chitinivibrionia bacterium]
MSEPDGQVPSEPIEVRFVLERGTVGAAQPVRDRIILDRQGGNRTVSTLWDGETNILANDAPTIDDPAVFAATVIMGDSTSRGELLLRADGTFTYTADVGLVNNQLRQPEDNFTYYSLTSPTDGEVRSDFPAFVDIFVNWYNDSTPKLTAKTDQLRAREGRVIPIITAADTDDDWGTILRINRNVPFTFTVNGVSTPASDPRFADVEIRGDSTIFFRYSADIAAPTTVVLTFHVNDDVNYMHYFNNNGVFDSIPYNFAHSTSNTLTLTIAPNPAAVDFEMQVREREHTSDIHYPTIGGEIYANILAALRDIWGDTWIESGVSFTLADSTQHGILTHNLTGAGSNGTVRYDHVNTAELTDRFVYTLAITLPDGTRISSDGTVVVRVMSREPFVMNDGFYEDRNADGTIDFVVIPFDRDVDLVNTTFGIVFEYGGETLTVQHDGGRFVRENDVPNRSLIEISLNNMPPNITDGSMTITITPPDNIWGAQQQVVRPRDAAAPVITSAMFTRSLFSNDTLVLTFSEPTTSISTGGGSLPFKFITEAGEEYTISFAERIPADNNREWTFIITMADGGIIVGGDSVFINYDNIIDEQNAVITDMAENSQTNPHNVRVPIERQTRTQILSATYWDDFGVLSNGRTSDALDGFIDRISIDLGMQVESSFAQRIAQALILPASRGFTKGDITLTETGFDLAVIEANAVWRDGRRTGEPRTSVGSDEVIGITEIADGSITVEASGITPFDRVAPVILRAYYVFSPDNPDTTLEVVFSEPVELIGRANTLPDSPYSFYSRNLVRNYNMIFVNSDPIRSADNIRWTYNVASSSIPYPLSGDSLWIMQGGHVFDADGNEAELTVRAPLILSDEYADNFELWVVPQPLRLVNVRGRTEPAVLDEGLARYYQIPIGTQGVALIVEAMGPVHPNHYNNRGTMRIINNVGNVVRENVEMRFVVIQDGDRAGNVVGVAVWDGKNDAGRFVGAATYLALIDVSVQFYDRPSPVRREFRRQISVSSAGTSAGD